MTDSPGSRSPTAAQKALDGYIAKFRNSSRAADEFLQFLRRSDAGLWRVQQDTIPGRWWLNITLPHNQQAIFALEREIQVLYSEYTHVEPRTLSLIQARVRKDMRVEPDVAILISNDDNVRHVARRRAGEMAIIPILLNEVTTGSCPPLHVLIAQTVSTVDHYDVNTPVMDPSGFYGRENEVDTIASDLARVISVGVFGLRKAGKTSLLNAIKSRRDEDITNVTFTVDLSAIVAGEQFRSVVLEGIWSAVKQRHTGRFSPRLLSVNRDGKRKTNVSDSATTWIQDLRTILSYSDNAALLVIDEVDQAYPPRSTLDSAEAVALFRSLVQLRSLLQEQDKLVLLCAGVDPALFERALIDGRDNLLYKLPRLVWLAPMSESEMAQMIRSLGKRMGVRIRGWEEVRSLYNEYGGHPLLTRKACSLAASARQPTTLPFHISAEALSAAFESNVYDGPKRQAADVLKSFTEWFPDEAALMELLYSSAPEERELATLIIKDDADAMLHAVAYGLCSPSLEPRISAAIRALRAKG
jgi:hypothetical protein